MQPKFIRISELASTAARPGRLPVSGATIWRWVKGGHFPSPVSLGPGTTAWPVDVIEQWEAKHSVAGAVPAAPAPAPIQPLPARQGLAAHATASTEMPPPKRGRGRPRKIQPAAAA